jgi:Fe-S-cluster containining protein
MLRTEAEKISDGTKQPISKFTVKVEDKLPYVYEMAKTKEYVCVFLKENQCTIYALRPLVCRFYPFELKTNEAGIPQFIATDECPGLRKGRVISEQNFRRLFRLARGTVKGERRLSETREED